MLASQESVLRSQPSEADYRAATVKQRPTSRRITPAEISVSAPTHCTLHTGRQHMLPCCHTFGLNQTHIVLQVTWTVQYYATLHTYIQYVRMQCFPLLCSAFSLLEFFEGIKDSLGFVVLQSLFERQGMTLHGGGLHPGIERGHIPLPKGMSRTKSFGKAITQPVHIQIC